jgi:chaperonin GroEL
MYKELLFDAEARNKILKGVQIVGKAVSSTLGPRGNNVIFEESSYPTITKDGVTVAQQVFLEDKFENMGAMIAREAAENTNREAGDGTTTTIVLLQAIFEEGHKAVASGMNPILIKRGMDFAADEIVKLLNKQAKKVTTEKEKLQIATISANNDESIGKLIADVIGKVGVDGTITVTNSNNLKTEVEYVNGTKLSQGYQSHVFINDPKHLAAVAENPKIIICTDDITMQAQLVPLFQKLITAGERNLILLANRIEGQALAFLVQNFLQGKFTCVPVKVPSFGDYQRDLIYDLAKLTNATVVGREDSKRLEDADIEDCGTCESVIVSRDQTILLGATGDVKDRIQEVKALLIIEQDEYRKDKLKIRLGRLTGSIANIKVGGASESEQTEIKYRIEDALNATKSAIEEGIVEGGGMALLKCVEGLKVVAKNKEFDTGVEIVRKALSMPLKKIADNGGVSGEAVVGKVLDHGIGYNALTDTYEDLFKAGIIDPKKVVRHEILNAVATSGILLTNSCAIIRKEEK